MKGINQKQKEFDDLMDKQERHRKDEEAKNKKNNAKLSYEEQKAADAVGFKDV